MKITSLNNQRLQLRQVVYLGNCLEIALSEISFLILILILSIAIITEEYGLIGAIVIVLMYMILLFRGVRIASRAPGSFGAFLAFGCCFSLVFQAFINMAVAVNIFLLLVSHYHWLVWEVLLSGLQELAIGIILSVSRESDKEEEKLLQEESDKKEEAKTEEVNDIDKWKLKSKNKIKIIISGGGTGGIYFRLLLLPML